MMLTENGLKEGIMILKAVGLPFGPDSWTKLIKDIWLDVLKQLSDDDFKKASIKCARTLDRFPTPKQIIEAAMPESIMSAEEAWSEVLEQKMAVCGTDQVPVFSSKVISGIVDNYGGLDRIWLAGVEKEGYFRKIFINDFNSQQAKEKKSLMVGGSQKVIE